MQNKIRLRKDLKQVLSEAGRQTKQDYGPEKKKTNGMEQHQTLPGFTPGGLCETTA